MSELILDDDTEVVDGLTYTDRCALAYFVAAQQLAPSFPARDTLPLLSDAEFAQLPVYVAKIIDDLREMAGQRGADLWRRVQ